MALVYAGVGSNLGDREANIKRAIELLKENKEFDVLAASALIETEPENVSIPQGKFLNGALKLETELLPLEVLSRFKAVERRLGRTKPEQNAPRTLDLDILFYDDVVIPDGKTLKIPHPGIAERRFVLAPLCEIAPEFVHPRLGKTVKELLAELDHAPHPQSPSAS